MRLSADINIVNLRGLHARAAAKFVRLASQFDADIDVIKDGSRVPGRSILGLITLGAQKGSSIRIEAEGQDGQSALDALRALVQSGFGEPE